MRENDTPASEPRIRVIFGPTHGLGRCHVRLPAGPRWCQISWLIGSYLRPNKAGKHRSLCSKPSNFKGGRENFSRRRRRREASSSSSSSAGLGGKNDGRNMASE